MHVPPVALDLFGHSDHPVPVTIEVLFPVWQDFGKIRFMCNQHRLGAALNAEFAHDRGHMRLYSCFRNRQVECDLLVELTLADEVQDTGLLVGQGRQSSQRVILGRPLAAFDKTGRRENLAFPDLVDGILEHRM